MAMDEDYKHWVDKIVSMVYRDFEYNIAPWPTKVLKTNGDIVEIDYKEKFNAGVTPEEMYNIIYPQLYDDYGGEYYDEYEGEWIGQNHDDWKPPAWYYPRWRCGDDDPRWNQDDD